MSQVEYVKRRFSRPNGIQNWNPALVTASPVSFCPPRLHLPTSISCTFYNDKLKMFTFCFVTLMKSLVLCFYVGPLFFNYCANIAEWSCELWLHFLLYTRVMTPCQQKDDVSTIKTNGFSFPVIHQLLKVVSSIYVFSHMNHDFLE